MVPGFSSCSYDFQNPRPCGSDILWTDVCLGRRERLPERQKKKKKNDTGGRRMQKAFIALNSTRGMRQDIGKF